MGRISVLHLDFWFQKCKGQIALIIDHFPNSIRPNDGADLHACQKETHSLFRVLARFEKSRPYSSRIRPTRDGPRKAFLV